MKARMFNAFLAWFLLIQLSMFLFAGAAAAQPAYPSQPIHWIVPYAAGSFVDVFARKLAIVVAREMPATIVIENRPGASGVIGAAEVAKSAPNGYTFLYSIADPLIASTVLQKTVPYDTFRDFAFIAKVQSGAPMLIVNPANAAVNIRDFIERAKTTRTTYGSFGPGSFPQLIMEQLSVDAGVKFDEVAYRSPPQAIQELTANQISAAFASPPTAKTLQDSGRAKVFAAVGTSRLDAFREVPTIEELGFNSLILRNPVWSGLFGPSAISAAVIDANVRAILHALDDAGLIQWAASVSADLVKTTPDQFRVDVRAEYDAVTSLIKKAGIKSTNE